MRQQALAAMAAQQQALARLDEMLANLSPVELAKAATRPALRFAVATIEDERADLDARLRAASLVLGLGHGAAPKAVDLTARVEAVRRVTPEAMRTAALALLQSPEVAE